MKKKIRIVLLLVMTMTLVGCSNKGKKEQTADLKKTERTFTMEQGGAKSEVVLEIKGDGVLKETVSVTTSFEGLGADTKEEAEALAKTMESQQSQVEGVAISVKVAKDEVIYSSETDYSKVALSSLGISEDMMAKDGKLPSVTVRVDDYETMGYKEKK